MTEFHTPFDRMIYADVYIQKLYWMERTYDIHIPN